MCEHCAPTDHRVDCQVDDRVDAGQIKPLYAIRAWQSLEKFWMELSPDSRRVRLAALKILCLFGGLAPEEGALKGAVVRRSNGIPERRLLAT